MREQGAEGADGNARLTGSVGMVLLVALFLGGLTLLEVSDLVTLHLFLGLVLIPPTALKIASTAYRFFRYYTHNPVYVRHGPPHPVLRMAAPLVIIFTMAVLATGVALLVVGPGQPELILTAHKASFILWFAAMTLHVLGHLREAVVLSRWDWLPRADRTRPRGKGLRRGLVAMSLVAGIALGTALLPATSAWSTRDDSSEQGRHALAILWDQG